jgi:hypothetical protein
MVGVIRTGLQTGECDLHRDDLAGVAVDIGAGVVACPARARFSSRARYATSSRDRGSSSPTVVDTLKGLSGEWELLAGVG